MKRGAREESKAQTRRFSLGVRPSLDEIAAEIRWYANRVRGYPDDSLLKKITKASAPKVYAAARDLVAASFPEAPPALDQAEVERTVREVKGDSK